MVEKIGNVRNPLTVIAIFAGIAEVSGSIVLPFISPCNQRLYIWFLIGFPSGLVVLFFATLIFKHRVFYAPSDFRDDKSFTELIKGFAPASSESISVKLAADAADNSEETSAKEDEPSSSSKADNPTVTVEHSAPQDLLSRYAEAENLVFKVLENERGLKFSRNIQVAAEEAGSIPFTCDGVAISSKGISMVEIKYFSRALILERIRNILHSFNAYIRSLSPAASKQVNFTLVVVLDLGAAERRETIESTLNRLAREAGFDSEIRVFTMNELRSLSANS